MTDASANEKIYDLADKLLKQGQQPSAEVIAARLDCDASRVADALAGWWTQVPRRLGLTKQEGAPVVPGVPDSLNQSFARIWDRAVEEARAMQSFEKKHIIEYSHDEAKRASDDELKKQQDKVLELESRFREHHGRYDEAQSQIKALEAEVHVLKSNLASETTSRKQEEQKRSNVDQELAHLRKSYDDARRTFDQRIKDEQRHTLEAVSKADADVRYYRNALEKVRDEAGKKESALTKNIHDLQGEIAKKDVKVETLRTQIKSIEAELVELKKDTTGRSRDISALNSQLLSETNKNKRTADKVIELEEQLRQQRQKELQGSSEVARRENGLRIQLKERNDELMRCQAKIVSLEKRIIGQDEEIRRLNARL